MQVTDDFELLSFLQTVAGELEITSKNWGLGHLSRKLLPLLREYLDAECLFVVGAVEQEEPSGKSSNNVGRILCHVGQDVLQQPEVVELIEMFRERATKNPIVQNHVESSSIGQQFPNVREFVLVPITKNERLHGWLVALNRVRKEVEPCDEYWQETRLEFGTPDASGMRTAATMLASHAQNVELFRQKEQLLTDMVRALVNAIEAKDEYTRGA